MDISEFDQIAFNHGQWESKIWLAQRLEWSLIDLEIDSLDKIHILGSWVGALALVFYTRGLKFNRIYNYDLDRNRLSISDMLLDPLKVTGRLSLMQKDVGTLEYHDVTERTLICNTSVDNIPGREWFKCIPDGTLVAIQTRTPGHDDCVNVCESLEEFAAAYPLSKTVYSGTKVFKYPQNSYNRFMLIGRK